MERRITGEDLREELDRIATERGAYQLREGANGPEMACAAMVAWAESKAGLISR